MASSTNKRRAQKVLAFFGKNRIQTRAAKLDMKAGVQMCFSKRLHTLEVEVGQGIMHGSSWSPDLSSRVIHCRLGDRWATMLSGWDDGLRLSGFVMDTAGKMLFPDKYVFGFPTVVVVGEYSTELHHQPAACSLCLGPFFSKPSCARRGWPRRRPGASRLPLFPSGLGVHAGSFEVWIMPLYKP